MGQKQKVAGPSKSRRRVAALQKAHDARRVAHFVRRDTVPLSTSKEMGDTSTNLSSDDRCLICNNPSSCTVNSKELISGSVKEVAFLVRILLDIPKEVVEDSKLGILGECVSTCQRCEECMEEAKIIYAQLLEVLRRFRAVQESVVHTLKESVEKDDRKLGDSKKRLSKNRERNYGCEQNYGTAGGLDLKDECRQYVSNRSLDWNTGDFVVTPELSVCSLLANDEIKEEIPEEDINALLSMELEDLAPPEHHFSPLHSETGEESRDSGKSDETHNNLAEEGTGQESVEQREHSEDMLDIQVKEEVDSDSNSGNEDNTDTEGAVDFCASHSVKGDNGQVLEFQEDSSGGYNCITCGTNLKHWQSLKYHARAIHKVELNDKNCPKYPCPKNGCKFVTKFKPSLEKHLRTHKKPTTKCKICGIEFYSNGLMLQHKREAHKKLALPPSIKVPEEPKAECPLCHKLYTNVRAVRKHIKLAHPGEKVRVEPHKLPCPWEGCDNVYTSRRTLENHLETHQGTPRFKCDICEEPFYQYNAMVRHKEREHDTAKICDICGHKTPTQSSLVQHRIIKHKIQPKQYILNKKKVGKETVTEDGKFKCDLCGKLFSHASGLSTHIKCDHEGKLSFVCEYCSKGFRSRLFLKHHQIVKHRVGDVSELPAQRPFDFQCPVKGCKKRFWGQKDDRLEKHMAKEHDGGTQYKYHCKYCSKGFAILHKLRTHEMGHENKETKPYKCEICWKSFSTPAYLRLHELTIHKAPRKLLKRKKFHKESVTADIQNS